MKDWTRIALIWLVAWLLALAPTLLFAQNPKVGGNSKVGGEAVLGSSAAGVTWTLIQHLNNLAGSGGTITITGVTTTAGDALVLASSGYKSTTGQGTYSSSSVSGDVTPTHCPSSYSYVTWTSALYSDCSFILSATGGTGVTVSFTWNNTSNNLDLEFYEVRRSTGTAIYDTSNNSNNSSAQCSTCTGPTLSLSGSSDYRVEFAAGQGSFSASGSPWTNPFDYENSYVDGAFAGALNQSNGNAITWNQTSGYIAMSSVAFK
jgi:hypothetical protein